MTSSEYCASCDLKSVRIIRKSAIFRNKDVTRYYEFIFNECDGNKDGCISISELKEFLAINEGDIPDHVVRGLHSCFDKDKDHKLNFEEFLDLINHPTVTETFKRVGSRYLKFIVATPTRNSLRLKRTVTNTGLYEEQLSFNWCTITLIVLSILQITIFYIDEKYDNFIKNYTRFDPDKKYQLWRYATHILNHSNTVHLYGNVAIQLLIGLPLEMVHYWRVPVIYVVGAIGGCLAHSVTFRTKSLVGGSAGFYAFYSAHLATVVMNWREMSHPFIHFIIFVILIAIDSVLSFIMDDGTSKISYAAHLGGSIVGFPLGIILLRNLKVTRFENIMWHMSLIIFSIFIVAFTIFNVLMNMHYM